MLLRWVVLRQLHVPKPYYASQQVPFASALRVSVVGRVEAEDIAEAKERARIAYGPKLEVTSELSWRQQCADETRLEKANRTRVVDLS